MAANIWRGTPTGKFVPYTAEQMTRKLEEVRQDLKNLAKTTALAIINVLGSPAPTDSTIIK